MQDCTCLSQAFGADSKRHRRKGVAAQELGPDSIIARTWEHSFKGYVRTAKEFALVRLIEIKEIGWHLVGVGVDIIGLIFAEDQGMSKGAKIGGDIFEGFARFGVG